MRRSALALLGLLTVFCANQPLEPSLASKRKPKPCTAGYVVTASTHSISGNVGDAKPASVTVVSPCGADVQNVHMTWTSRNTAVVAAIPDIDKDATLNLVGPGSTYVFITSDGGGGDSIAVSVSGVSTCTPTPTNICPGDDANAKVQAQGSGTAFTFGAGTFVQQKISPKSNDTFTGAGQSQTILTGSRTLTSWTLLSGSTYYTTGQTQQNSFKTGFQCDATHPLCYQPEQLWVNNNLYIPVASTGALGAGKWFFDYAADRIYLPFNPTDSTVETSVAPWAFMGTATGVQISNLTVKRYANGNGWGAIGYQTSGANWTVTNVKATENHGVGIKGFSHWFITGSSMLTNGQMGYSCTGTGPHFSFDTIVGNNTAGNTAGAAGEAGAGKCTTSDSLLFEKSYVSRNHGPGMWTDIDNIHTTYHKNVVDSNDWRGIDHEISYDAVIDSNTVIGNGFNNPFVTPGATDGAGIFISNSPNVEIFGNTVRDNKHGIAGYETDRGSGAYGPHNITNLHVHNNTVVQTDGGRAGGTTDSDPSADPYSASANNVWDHNTYTLGVSTVFRWSPNADKTWAQWVAAGQDVGSTESGQ